MESHSCSNCKHYYVCKIKAAAHYQFLDLYGHDIIDRGGSFRDLENDLYDIIGSHCQHYEEV